VKTYVLDASALYVYLQDKPAANKVNQLLKEAVRERAEILMSAVNYGEVYGAILREHGADRATATMSAVQPLPIRLVDATPQRAVHAADVKSKYKLYYVDSFAAALAIEYKATLVTSDSDFRKLGQGLPVVWLKG
jgi:predicted nucleic acid-binding protein